MTKKLLLSNKSKILEINDDPQSLNWMKPIRTYSGNNRDNSIELMITLKYSILWELLLNDLNSEEIILLLNAISKDDKEKTESILNLPLFKNSSVAMKVNAIKNININESRSTKLILLESYQKATTIEKTSLISLYPKVFNINFAEFANLAKNNNIWIQIGILENLINFYEENKLIIEPNVADQKIILLIKSQLSSLIKLKQ